MSFLLKNPLFPILTLVLCAGPAMADLQTPTSGSAAPRVVVSTGDRARAPSAANQAPASAIRYPWKIRVTCTVFWIGEDPSNRNPTTNRMSSWDQKWTSNFGGVDDPSPSNRVANHSTGDFRPKGFIPKLNPFYVALPYNDVTGSHTHKPEASKVIPWFARMQPEPGKSVCKGRWVQIYNGSRSCYAQWEDCGPWMTDDWEFVFGNKPPKNTQNGAAGIDISPSIRDYLSLGSGKRVHWRFVEASQVPYGPWKKYGQDPAPTSQPDLLAQQRSLEYLRKLRDEGYQKKSLGELQN
ncbi:MAG: hypothetical protein ORN51_02490 [Akkermansiaceae bacterium]|nr:hypothetical protein [Akkermansiaceae bacterium]